MKIFIDETPVETREDTTVRETLRELYPEKAAKLDKGGYLTDGTGRELDAGSVVTEGLIVRCVGGGHDSGDTE